MNKYAKKNNITICLCVIAKNENLYVREFIEHYKSIGYDKIFIYDNNEVNGEKFEEVIYDYIKNGFVKIIYFRKTSPLIRPQFEAYKDCYSRYNRVYDWISFYDMDEFLEINEKYKNIHDFLIDKNFKHCQNIKINWLNYFDNNILYYEKKSLYERFKYYNKNDTINKHIKSTVKGNLPLNYWERMNNPHTSELNFTSCSSSGKIIQYDSPFYYPPDYTNAKLRHYSQKSFEEYCIKLKKGKADSLKNLNNKMINEDFQRLYSENKNIIEKLKIIKNIFNNSFY